MKAEQQFGEKACRSIILTIIVKINSVSSLKAISDNITFVWSGHI